MGTVQEDYGLVNDAAYKVNKLTKELRPRGQSS